MKSILSPSKGLSRDLVHRLKEAREKLRQAKKEAELAEIKRRYYLPEDIINLTGFSWTWNHMIEKELGWKVNRRSNLRRYTSDQMHYMLVYSSLRGLKTSQLVNIIYNLIKDE